MANQTESAEMELLEQNRQRLLRELRSKARQYEARHELRSTELEAALASGRLHDTAEVCDWVIAVHTIRALERE